MDTVKSRTFSKNTTTTILIIIINRGVQEQGR